MGDDASNSGIQSVSRAFRILELFTERRPELSAGEVAVLTGLNRATAYRFCQTLLGLGYLEETSPHRFRPGLRAVSLARAALSSRELPDLALPYLRSLRKATGETVNLALLDGPDVVYVSRLLSDSLLTLRLFVGSRLPAYASSLGRAMLAFLPEPELEELLGPQTLQAFTEHTIVEPERLKAELRRVRAKGYAVNDEELVAGIRGIAAPVFDISARPVAAVNISMARRPAPPELESLAAHVVNTAKAITELATHLAVDVAPPHADTHSPQKAATSPRTKRSSGS